MADYPVCESPIANGYANVRTSCDYGGTIFTPPPPPTGQRVANMHSAIGQYYVANGDGSGIRVRRADGYTPRTEFPGMGGFQSDVHATSDPDDTNPALTEDHQHIVYLFFENNATVYFASSGDRGVTWSSPETQMTGILPATTVGKVHRQIVCVTVQGDGSLLGTVQYPGDRWPNDNYTGGSAGTSSDAPYVLVDDSGSPIVTDGTGVALSNPDDGFIEMALILDGESDLSHWVSGDKKARTWRKIT